MFIIKIIVFIIGLSLIPRVIGLGFNLINQIFDQLTNIQLFPKKQNKNIQDNNNN